MTPPDNITCHDTQHKKKCKDLCMNCWKWMQVQGIHPNTGEQLNEWRCADNWKIVFAQEIAKMENQTGAAVESFRNEMVKDNVRALSLLNKDKLLQSQ